MIRLKPYGLWAGILIFVLVQPLWGQESQYELSNLLTPFGSSAEMVGNGPNGAKTIAWTIGQPAVGDFTGATPSGDNYGAGLGIWNFLKLQPMSPFVFSSDGEYDDHIEVTWQFDALSPAPDEGFKIYRDGGHLATLSANAEAFQDFNVYAGQVYNYSVRGINEYGDGGSGADPGFVNPNGTITGRVTSENGRPIKDVEVSLSPNLGQALVFDSELQAHVKIPILYTTPPTQLTVEAWVYCDSLSLHTTYNDDPGNYSVVYHGNNGEFDLRSNMFAIKYGSGYGWQWVTIADPPVGEWYHIAGVWQKGDSLAVFVNGELADRIAAYNADLFDPDTTYSGCSIGSKNRDRAFFPGKIDEVRIWTTVRSEDEIQFDLDRTLRGDEADLRAYWKLDEGLSNKIFDLTDNDFDGDIAAAVWTDDTAPVNAKGFTDDQGNYVISGIFYGSGTTFHVIPEKIVPIGASLLFDGVDDYAEVAYDDINSPEGSLTIEAWARISTTGSGNADIISQHNNEGGSARSGFVLSYNHDAGNFYSAIGNENGWTTINGSSWNANEWHHVALVYDEDLGEMTVFEDGNWLGSAAVDSISANEMGFWIGASENYGNYFAGNIDEVRYWTTARTQGQIQGTMNDALDGNEEDLYGYWQFNEGRGTVAAHRTNSTLNGALINTDDTVWSDDCPFDEVIEHEFNPEYRVVTLNPSNTSTDNVNFTDLTQIAVSGYVRYVNTRCWADSVEILVDGVSAEPEVFSESDGSFLVEFEPGSSHRISCTYKDHDITLENGALYYEVDNINFPVAGVLFEDQTVRDLTLNILGGDCRYPLAAPGGHNWEVTLRSLPSCFEVNTTTPNSSITLQDLPPLDFTIEITHPDPDVELDGQQVSLSDSSRTYDFIHYEPITVTIEPSWPPPPDSCAAYTGPDGEELAVRSVLEQNQTYALHIEIFEDYNKFSVGHCPIDTGTVTIANNIADEGNSQVTFSQGQVVNEEGEPANILFIAGEPNILAGGDYAYQKSVQVLARELIAPDMISGRTATSDPIWVYVAGDRLRGDMFVTIELEAEPMFILRDPPGDNSYSYIVEEVSHTSVESYTYWDGQEFHRIGMGRLDFNQTASMDVGWPVSIGLETAALEIFGEWYDGAVITQQSINTTESSTTITSSQSFATTDDETGFVEGENVGDVIVGMGKNLVITKSDYLSYDNCAIFLETRPAVDSIAISSMYVYSTYHIENVLIPELESLFDQSETHEDSVYYEDQIEEWQAVIALNDSLIEHADVVEDDDFLNGAISFDGGAGAYEFQRTMTTGNVVAHEYSLQWDKVNEHEAGAFAHIWGVGGGGSQNWGWTTFHGASWRGHNEAGDTSELDDNVIDFEISGDNWSYSLGKYDGYTDGNTWEISDENSTTFGFVLGDDDLGDYFWVDIKDDGVYGLVYNLHAGASSCPWEIGTASRQSVAISLDQNAITQVPPDEAAVFTMSLGNLSETDDAWYYYLYTPIENNPDGAVLKVNGQNITGIDLPYYIEAGETVQATLTVERGPEAYVYDDLQIALLARCEADLAEINGTDMPAQMYADASFSVHFLQPCSEVEISEPNNNWWVTPDDRDTLTIVLTDYDKENALLSGIKLYYRPVTVPGGRMVRDGWASVESKNLVTSSPAVDLKPFPPDYRKQAATIVLEPIANDPRNDDVKFPKEPPAINNPDKVDGWINFHTISRQDLLDETNDYYVYSWDVGLLGDGNYEIKATTHCLGDAYNSSSAVLAGVIERRPPSVLGTPQPGDGILNIGDDIALTFNERINCGPVHPVNNGELIISETSAAVDYDFTCSDYILVVTPNIANHFIENKTLRMTVSGITDLYDNELVSAAVWEFWVNRNPLIWLGGDVSATKYEDETVTITRQISNTGSSAMTFNFVDLNPNPGREVIEPPAWLNVSPLSGTVSPGTAQTITLEFDADLSGGLYEHDLIFRTAQGDEPLRVNLENICYAPDWSVEASDFEYSMTITGKLLTDGDPPTDRILVGAFVDGQPRGSASVEYVHTPTVDDTLVYLTIYSNQQSGESITIRAYDGLACGEIGQLFDGFAFVANDVLGHPQSPEIINLSAQVVVSQEYSDGWSWFSLNVEPDDPAVNTILGGLTAADGDLIKSQTQYCQYVPGHGWVGQLENLNADEMYMIRLGNEAAAEIIGYPVDLAASGIPIDSGWNWIAYQPQSGLDVTTALSSLTNAVTGDLIKNQFAYAQFVAGSGWLGSLNYMQPELGYLLKVANPSTLTYPQPPPATSLIANSDWPLAGDKNQPSLVIEQTKSLPEGWVIDPAQYEFSLNITGRIDSPHTGGTGEVLAAFVDEECRGIASPIYVEAFNQWLYFLTAYSNMVSGDVLAFKVYAEDADTIYPLVETVTFEANDIIGQIQAPFIWTYDAAGIEGEIASIPTEFSLGQNYPNPFVPHNQAGVGTTIHFALPIDSEVEIAVYNSIGQRVKSLVIGNWETGNHAVVWNGENDSGEKVQSGVYFYRMRTSEGLVDTKKLLLLK